MDQEAGVLVEGIFGIVADKQLGSTVVVEVGHERVDRAPAGGLDPAVGGVAVRAASVNHDLVVAVGAATVVVDERNANFVAGSAEEPCATGVLAREAPRLRHELAVFEAVEQRVVRVKPVPGALRKEDHVIERRYVGCRAGGHYDAVFRQKPGCGAAPDPAGVMAHRDATSHFAGWKHALPGRAGGDRDVLEAVAVEVARGGRHGERGVEFEDSLELAICARREKHELRAGGEREAGAPAEAHRVHETRGRAFLLQLRTQARLLLRP